MGWIGYVPDEIYKKHSSNQDMMPVLETYGMLRKHEAGNEDLSYLFGEIALLKRREKDFKATCEYHESYIASIEKKLGESLTDGGNANGK